MRMRAWMRQSLWWGGVRMVLMSQDDTDTVDALAMLQDKKVSGWRGGDTSPGTEARLGLYVKNRPLCHGSFSSLFLFIFTFSLCRVEATTWSFASCLSTVCMCVCCPERCLYERATREKASPSRLWLANLLASTNNNEDETNATAHCALECSQNKQKWYGPGLSCRAPTSRHLGKYLGCVFRTGALTLRLESPHGATRPVPLPMEPFPHPLTVLAAEHLECASSSVATRNRKG